MDEKRYWNYIKTFNYRRKKCYHTDAITKIIEREVKGQTCDY